MRTFFQGRERKLHTNHNPHLNRLLFEHNKCIVLRLCFINTSVQRFYLILIVKLSGRENLTQLASISRLIQIEEAVSLDEHK